MSEERTPGSVAYEAFRGRAGRHFTPAWVDMGVGARLQWEGIAQAVLDVYGVTQSGDVVVDGLGG